MKNHVHPLWNFIPDSNLNVSSSMFHEFVLKCSRATSSPSLKIEIIFSGFFDSGISGNTSSRYLTLSMSSQFYLSLIKIDWHDAKIYIYINTPTKPTTILSIISIQTRSNHPLIITRSINNLIFMQLFDAKYSGILKNEDANMNISGNTRKGCWTSKSIPYLARCY